VGPNPGATVTGDIATLRSDLNNVIADVKAGTDPSADLIQAETDAQALFAALGTKMTRAVQHDVLDLVAVGADAVVDLTGAPSAQSVVTTVEANLANLIVDLGPNVSASVSKDLNRLLADLTSLAGDIQAGTSTRRDLGHAIRDEARLFHDLNGQLVPIVTFTIVAMDFDLLEISPGGHI
jgi:hypothetical protein